MPHGDCPSLKFHCRSDSWVLLISTGVVDEKVVLEETELLGTKASVFEASTRTERSAKSTIVENLKTAIVAVYKLNVYEARLIQVGLLILLLFLNLAVQSKEKLSGFPSLLLKPLPKLRHFSPMMQALVWQILWFVLLCLRGKTSQKKSVSYFGGQFHTMNFGGVGDWSTTPEKMRFIMKGRTAARWYGD